MLGVSYTKAYDAREEAVEKGERPKDRLMCCAVLGFIGYDWGFLFYSFVFCFSIAFDIVVIVVGAMGLQDGSCLGAIGNLTSGCLHIILRFLLFCMWGCILQQIQCSENPLCRPWVTLLTCGLMNPEKQAHARRQRAERKRAAKGGIDWINQENAK